MTNPTPSLWPTLLDQVDSSGGVLKVSIEFLRQIAGAQRMGPNVAAKIEAGLDVQGLRAFPSDLSGRKQYEEVILVKAATPAYECIQSISAGEATDALVTWLTRLNTLPKDPETLVDRQELRKLAEDIVDPVSRLLGFTRPYGDEEGGEDRVAARQEAVRQALVQVAAAQTPSPTS